MAIHRSSLQKWWPAPLRIFLGLAFVYHGMPKLFTGGGHQNLVASLQQMSVPDPRLMAWVVGLVEFVGGIALLLGVTVTLASALLLFEMLVAMIKVHLPHGFSFVQVVGQTASGPVFGLPGAEVNLLYIAALLALLIGGPGPLSIEAWNGQRRSHPPRMERTPREAHA